MSSAKVSGMLRLAIAADHAAFAGHFPGMPIVPGVVLLDEALHAVGTALRADLSACRIGSAKFLSPVRPGEPVEVRYDMAADGTVRLELTSGERKVASASVRMATGEAAHGVQHAPSFPRNTEPQR